jgi:hypothetical protein
MNDLSTLLKVIDTLKEECPLVPTPSISITTTGDFTKTKKQKDKYYLSYNDGLLKALSVVMDMIKEIAKFVSVCCGERGILNIEKWKGGGRCYTICSKCKKECKEEWRKKREQTKIT